MSTNNLWPTHAAKLSGGWKLVSFEVFSKDKTLVGKPHGEEPLGRVLISPTGYLSAHLARPELMQHLLPSSKPWQQGGDEEIAHVARGLSMYCGYLQLFEDEQGLYWQTKVEVSVDPAWMGGIQERRVEYWEECGKTLMKLEPRNDMVMDDGTTTRAVLVWEKFESA